VPFEIEDIAKERERSVYMQYMQLLAYTASDIRVLFLRSRIRSPAFTRSLAPAGTKLVTSITVVSNAASSEVEHNQGVYCIHDSFL
jgi:hypothetical protein